MRKIMILLNIVFLTLMVIFTFKVFDGYAEVSVITTAILLYLAEAVIFLFTFLYISDHTKELIVKVLKIYVIVVFSLLCLIFLLEIIFSWKFVLYFSYRFIIYAFLIYPLILRIFLKISMYYVFKDQISVTVVTSIIVVILLVINGIMAGLTMKSISIVRFDDTDIEFVLVEESSFFSQSHRLYLKANALFAGKQVSSWDCWDCYVNNPNRYVWTWIDEDRLEISGGGLEEAIMIKIN